MDLKADVTSSQEINLALIRWALCPICGKPLQALFRLGPSKKRRNKEADSPAILAVSERFLSQVHEPQQLLHQP